MEEKLINIEEPKKEEKKNNKKKIILFVFIILLVLIGFGVAVYFLVIKDNNQSTNEETTTTTTRRKIDGIPNSLEEFALETKTQDLENDNYKHTELYVPYENIYSSVCNKTRTIEGHKTYATCNELCVTGEEGCSVTFTIDDNIKFEDITDGCSGNHYYMNKDKNFVIKYTGSCAPGLGGITIYTNNKEIKYGYGENGILKLDDNFGYDFNYGPYIKDDKLYFILADFNKNDIKSDYKTKCRVNRVDLDSSSFNVDYSDYFECEAIYGE